MNVRDKKYQVETEFIKLLGIGISGGLAGISVSIAVNDGEIVYQNLTTAICVLMLALIVYVFFANWVIDRTR